jgi:hypothetical protein
MHIAKGGEMKPIEPVIPQIDSFTGLLKEKYYTHADLLAVMEWGMKQRFAVSMEEEYQRHNYGEVSLWITDALALLVPVIGEDK